MLVIFPLTFTISYYLGKQIYILANKYLKLELNISKASTFAFYTLDLIKYV